MYNVGDALEEKSQETVVAKLNTICNQLSVYADKTLGSADNITVMIILLSGTLPAAAGVVNRDIHALQIKPSDRNNELMNENGDVAGADAGATGTITAPLSSPKKTNSGSGFGGLGGGTLSSRLGTAAFNGTYFIFQFDS